METLIDIFFHLDTHLNEWILIFGPWIYVILFLVIFCETGLVVTPFLPGDSLLFALGALSATGNASLELGLLILFLATAAILGDSINYAIGAGLGPRVFSSDTNRWLNKKHLLRTHKFYEKYGGKTIVFARFIPIVRTFAPFVAGIGKMSYPRFIVFNIFGGILWVLLFLLAGFYFGNIPTVKKNFQYVIMGIIVVSFVPIVVEYLKNSKFQGRKNLLSSLTNLSWLIKKFSLYGRK